MLNFGRLLHLLAVAGLAAVGAARAAAAERPNFIFLLADDMRPDCIGALGHPVIKTPNLDTLAREGTVFTRAVAAYPICNVSRAEILTGTTAFRNRVGYPGSKIDPSLKTWADTLRDAGYHTWHCGKWHNDGSPTSRGYEETRGLFTAGGLPKGSTLKPLPDHAGRNATGYVGYTFKTDDGKVELDKGVGLTPQTTRHIADAAIEFIDRKSTKAFFLHVNFTAPHDPRLFPPGYEHLYDPAKIPLPKNFRPQHPFDHGNQVGRDEVLLPKPLVPAELREELAAYYALISDLDEQIGRIISALRANGQLDSTVIIFSSDQGMAMGSHGLLGKQNLYEHTFGVPLIFRGPGIPKGVRTHADCYLRDLFPTTCDLAGIPIPTTVQGKSLVPILRGQADSVYDFVIGYFTDTQRAIRAGDWKLIEYPRITKTQLFNLHADPDELNDLAGKPDNAAVEKRLRAQLHTWLKEQGDAAAGG